MQQSPRGAKVFVRKQPIINRGYYTRVSCFRQTIENFLDVTKGSGPRQIINIGCGYDTQSFHLMDEGHEDLFLWEVDYDDVLMRKTDMIRRSVELNALLKGSGNPLGSNYGFDTDMLKFVAADLQDATVVEALAQAGLNPNHPTLILSECVLVCKCVIDKPNYPNKPRIFYCFSIALSVPSFRADMDATCVSSLGTSLVSFFAESCAPVAWLSYDMFNPTDPFGKMMRCTCCVCYKSCCNMLLHFCYINKVYALYSRCTIPLSASSLSIPLQVKLGVLCWL